METANILVVEDEIITAEVIAEQLTNLGYTVLDTVASGKKAIAIITQTQPDLVLMDIVLKKREIDGIDTAKQIQAQFKIPVVYLTAHSDEITLERAKTTHPYGYIVKPFNEQDLRVGIEFALAKYQMEQKLAAREALLDAMLKSTQEAVITTDRNGMILYMNPAAETLTGWQEQQALKKDIKEVVKIVDANSQKLLTNPVTSWLKQMEYKYFEQRIAIVAQDGIQTPVTESISPLLDETGEIIGAVLLLRDIREAQQLEKLILAQKTLTTKVIQSLHSETEVTRILAAEKELHQLRSRLITTISHEYRTPLTVVLTSAEMLQNYSHKWSDEKKEKHYNQIKQAVKQMTQLIEDVLKFNDTESGKISFNPALLEIEKLCRKIINEQQIKTGNSCTINFSVEGVGDAVFLDEDLVDLILNHLLNNAIKYSPKFSTVELLVIYEENQVILKVKDAGIGIPESDYNQLFSNFFRGSNIGNIGGTGMGLSIVKKCVELHKGEIYVESEVNVGTTFTVKLPSKYSNTN